MYNLLLGLFILLNTLISGLYFTFTNTIIPVLKTEENIVGIRLMNQINQVIQNIFFFLLFFGTPILGITLLIIDSTIPMVWIGVGLHIIGSFFVTIFRNVPLNNLLLNEASDVNWERYVEEWLRWNTIRMIAGIVSAVVLIIELSI